MARRGPCVLIYQINTEIQYSGENKYH